MKQNLKELKGKEDKLTIATGEIDNFLSLIKRMSR